MDRKPIILINARDINDASGNVYVMNKEYGKAVREAGGMPFGAASYKTIAEYVEFADALILSNGGTIHPFRYGALMSGPEDLQGFSQTQDDFDFCLLDAFVKAGKPVLGINRGMLVINAYFGGKIQKMIPPKPIVNGEPMKPRLNEKGTPVAEQPMSILNHKYAFFDIKIAEDSRLCKYLGTKAHVNSFHTQCCQELADGLKATAWSPDGIIEAFESEDGKYFGVQWDPEHSAESYTADYSVFRMFIDAVKEGK